MGHYQGVSGQKSSNLSTGINADGSTEQLLKLQNELINPEFPPQKHLPLLYVDEDEPMNAPFILDEFKYAVNAPRKDSAPARDHITYLITKKLPPSGRKLLLNIFNRMFLANEYPETWRESLIIFIPKPEGKGFRLISLASCLSKVFERLIHRSLEFFVENQRWLPPFQYGCRRARSSNDCVTLLYTDILLAFEQNSLKIKIAKQPLSCLYHWILRGHIIWSDRNCSSRNSELGVFRHGCIIL